MLQHCRPGFLWKQRSDREARASVSSTAVDGAREDTSVAMFKFLRKKTTKKQKKGTPEIEAREEFPDFTAQQLVQRFHSESSLCDPSHRRILIEAAEETHAQIQLRQSTLDVRQQAADSCRQLKKLQTSVTDLRASQQDIDVRATLVQDHIAVHNAPIPMLEQKTDEYQERIVSLVAMTDMIQQAAETVEGDWKACVQQRRARSHSKAARLRDSLDSKGQLGCGLDYETSVSCMEFGRGQATVDAERPLADLIKETHDYIDENARTWQNIDPEALHKELAAVKELLEVYEESTRSREERIALAEFRSNGVL
jgi:hypothetical protein